MLISLFATSDLARLVAERTRAEASFTSFPRAASSLERPVLPRVPLVHSQERGDDCSQSWRLRPDRVECRVSLASPRGHPVSAAAYTNYAPRRSSFRQYFSARD